MYTNTFELPVHRKKITKYMKKTTVTCRFQKRARLASWQFPKCQGNLNTKTDTKTIGFQNKEWDPGIKIPVSRLPKHVIKSRDHTTLYVTCIQFTSTAIVWLSCDKWNSVWSNVTYIDRLSSCWIVLTCWNFNQTIKHSKQITLLTTLGWQETGNPCTLSPVSCWSWTRSFSLSCSNSSTFDTEFYN